MPVLDGSFEAFVTNLGKYNEGELVGEWVHFPTTEEEMKKVFERIGIGSKDEFGQVYVQRGVVKLSHQESITKDPKTTSGDRMVYLSKEMCQLLKAWRKECEWDRQQTANETVSEDDYLFRQPNGKPMNPCTFTYRFKLILKANNLPLDLSVHSLRHTNASLLISQGVDVRTVASLLGHAQASTTLDIYAHAFDKNKRKAQEKLGKAIGL